MVSVSEEVAEESTVLSNAEPVRGTVMQPLLSSHYKTWSPQKLYEFIVRYAKLFGYAETIAPRQETSIVSRWGRWELNPKDAHLYTLRDQLQGRLLVSSRRMTQQCQREVRRIVHLQRFAEMLRAYTHIPSRDRNLLSC